MSIANLPGKHTTIDSGTVAIASGQRVAGKPHIVMRNGSFTVIGADGPGSFFGPQQPIIPMAQTEAAGAIGRQWDYPTGYNLLQTPRSGEALSFPTLQAMADNYDVLRAVIETRKDQVAGASWSIGPKDRTAKRDDKLCGQLEAFWRSPDQVHSWADWIRMVLEQLFVYDAPAFWCQPNRKGELYALQVLDGATIKRVLTLDGRTPEPDEGPAYQAILKGIPAVDYIKPMPFGQKPPMATDGLPMPELIYKPRNPRVDRVYGFGPVEQIVTTVNIALRRELYQLNYYSAGSTPDLVFQVPDSWNPDQISQFSQWWESMLKGNLENRRGTMFVPSGVKPFDTKEKALKDEYDEWLIRIVCFAFSISPQPFVKQMNRATANSAHEQAVQEGLAPVLRWIVDLVDYVHRVKFGIDDVSLRWDEDDAVDPLEQSQIFGMYLDKKVYHPDEIRQKLGEDAMDDAMRLEMDMPTFSAAANATVLPEEQEPDEPEPQFVGPAGAPAFDAAGNPINPGAKGKPGSGPFPSGAKGKPSAPGPSKLAPAVASNGLGKGRKPYRRSIRTGRVY